MIWSWSFWCIALLGLRRKFLSDLNCFALIKICIYQCLRDVLIEWLFLFPLRPSVCWPTRHFVDQPKLPIKPCFNAMLALSSDEEEDSFFISYRNSAAISMQNVSWGFYMATICSLPSEFMSELSSFLLLLSVSLQFRHRGKLASDVPEDWCVWSPSGGHLTLWGRSGRKPWVCPLTPWGPLPMRLHVKMSHHLGLHIKTVPIFHTVRRTDR